MPYSKSFPQKGSALILVLLGLVLVGGSVFGTYFVINNNLFPPSKLNESSKLAQEAVDQTTKTSTEEVFGVLDQSLNKGATSSLILAPTPTPTIVPTPTPTVTPTSTPKPKAAETKTGSSGESASGVSSGQVKSIYINVEKQDGNKAKVTWNIDGNSPLGFKVVWGSSSGPTYPLREGDQYHYYNDSNKREDIINNLSGKTYYFRVCEYLGGKCGVYSNEVSVSY